MVQQTREQCMVVMVVVVVVADVRVIGVDRSGVRGQPKVAEGRQLSGML